MSTAFIQVSLYAASLDGPIYSTNSIRLPAGVLYIAAQGSYHLSSSLLHTFSPLKEGANLVLGALGQPQLL